ncbi:MAG: tetratricopeptide repeat protein [Bacteroidia bacterium]|nr:tetratricopeptide repeat protein [Bacteroidia bacterium]
MPEIVKTPIQVSLIRNNSFVKSILFLSMMILLAQWANAQPERKMVRSGNGAYEKGNYSEAEIKYRKGLEKNETSFNATFNLGNALYKQEKFEEAARQFNGASTLSTEKSLTAHDYHNLGNAYFKMQKFNECIEAYKNALRLNPKDDDTRYNLAYAQKILKEQEQNQQNEKNKDQQDNKKNDQNQKEQEQQNQQQQNQQQPKDQSGDARKPDQKISKEEAEQILEALKNNEKEIQKKLNKKEGQRIEVEKQW